jgi:hypothetical protein
MRVTEAQLMYSSGPHGNGTVHRAQVPGRAFNGLIGEKAKWNSARRLTETRWTLSGSASSSILPRKQTVNIIGQLLSRIESDRMDCKHKIKGVVHLVCPSLSDGTPYKSNRKFVTQVFRMNAIESRKGSTMFRIRMVIWIVLLMLALNVVAFATRIIEKYRPVHRLSKSAERTVSIAQTSELATLKHRRS